MNNNNFYKNKSNGLDGFHPYCKQCTKDKAWKWQKENWDKMLIHFKKENDKPEKRDRVLKAMKERREDGRYREWQRNNPDKVRVYRLSRMNKKHTISKNEWLQCKLYFDNSCAYCGTTEKEHMLKFNQDLHKEHVDHEGSNGIENCVPSCKKCNSSKSTHSLTDWYSEDNSIFNKDRELKIHKWLNDDVKLIQNKI